MDSFYSYHSLLVKRSGVAAIKWSGFGMTFITSIFCALIAGWSQVKTGNDLDGFDKALTTAKYAIPSFLGIMFIYFLIWFLIISPYLIWKEQKSEISELTPRRLKLTELSPVALEIYQEISTIESRYGGWPPQEATDEMLSSLRDKETAMSDKTLSRFIDELRTYCDKRNKMGIAYPNNFSIRNADIENEVGFNLIYNQFNAYILLYCRAIKERLLGEQDFEYIDSIQYCVDGYSFNAPNQVSMKLSKSGVKKIIDGREQLKRLRAMKDGDIIK